MILEEKVVRNARRGTARSIDSKLVAHAETSTRLVFSIVHNASQPHKLK